MKKILGLSVAAMMIMALVGGGTWAFFSDPEAIVDNVFTAGTIDLHVDGDMSWTDTIGWTNVAPGTTDTLAFENAGTINGILTFSTTGMANLDEADDEVVDILGDFEYSAAVDPDAYEMSAADYAKLIEVTDAGHGFVAQVIAATGDVGTGDTNGDGKLSLNELYNEIQGDGVAYTLNTGVTLTLTFTMYHGFQELTAPATAFYSGSMKTYSDAALDIDYDLFGTGASTDVWNVPQADGITVDISVTLEQA
jgi:predicted ribosomally synthesized peptide with SipW-like signal peptide